MPEFVFGSRHVVSWVMIVAFFFLSGCAASPDLSDVEKEKWTGELTGMLEGDLEMSIARLERQGEVVVKGYFHLTIRKTAGGYGGGTARGSIDGAIVDGVLNANLSGRASVQEGSSGISGALKGPMSETVASGAWSIRHREGLHSGKWIAERRELE